MSADDRVTYLDSSAVVKLVLREDATDALRRTLRRRRILASSALARTEVLRAVMPFGAARTAQAHEVLRGLELLRVNDRVLDDAGSLEPASLRPLDAIHLATARQLGSDLRVLITYDVRMADAARELGMTVESPS